MIIGKHGHLSNCPTYFSVLNLAIELGCFAIKIKQELKLSQLKKRKHFMVFNAIEEYETILYQQLGIMLTLDKKFEKLDGFIEIVFEIPNGNKKEIRIPVDISIQDTLE